MNRTRREILQILALTGASTMVSRNSGHGITDGANSKAIESGASPDCLDVAIVGAGIAGVYASWRLLDTNNRADSNSGGRLGERRQIAPRQTRLRCALFEGADRVGGRIRSEAVPGAPHLRAELGGMCFPETHATVVKLVEHLGLAMRELPGIADANLFYLRGRRFRLEDWGNPGLPPYDLNYKSRRVEDLLARVVKHYIPDAEGLSESAWEEIKSTYRVGIDLLADQSFWTLALKAVGVEAYQLLQDTSCPFGSICRSWNAAEVMSWIMAHAVARAKYFTLSDGCESLTRAMTTQFTAMDGDLLLRHRLVRIRRDPAAGGFVRLDFELPENRTKTYRARKVILALPRRSIESLEQDSFLFESQDFVNDLKSVSPQPAMRIFLGYSRPWWKDLGITGGCSITDLPVRQCRYIGCEKDQEGVRSTNENSLLMVSLNDDAEVRFWEAFGKRAKRDISLSELPSNAPGVPEELLVPEPLIAELHREIQELHGAVEIPYPYMAMMANWTGSPFCGVRHFWNVHSRPWEIIPRMRQPFPDANLYICGEAWSGDQGWIRGSLHSAERLLQEKFSLPRPTWLPSDVHLGA